MQKYTLKNGTTSTAESFTRLPKLTSGYEWRNVSELGAGSNHWHEVPIQPENEDDKLFGYDKHQFMRRQYK